jgi:hypothetical protein
MVAAVRTHTRRSGVPVTVSEWTMRNSTTLAADALVGLLLPLWQVVIGVLVLVAVVVSVRRLALRGPSRMSAAMLVVGGAVVCLAVLGYLFQGL